MNEHNFTTLKAVYNWAVYDVADPRVGDWLFMQTPIETLVLTALYYVIVFSGLKVMENHKPFQLKYTMILYNIFMVALSGWMCVEMAYLIWAAGFSLHCSPVDYSTNEIPMRMAGVLWWYYFSKFIEFIDTFAMVLRKKNRQVSFLHVYHHGSMFCIWWMGVKWAAGGMSIFGPLMNTFIHVIMYTYYLLAALGIQPWWKKHLTQIQLIQFCVAIGHSLYALHTECNFPRWMMWALVGYAFSLLVLFSNFFLHAYVKKSMAKKSQANGKTTRRAKAD